MAALPHKAREIAADTNGELVVRLDIDPGELPALLPRVRVCIINTDNFADGRGFSLVSLASRTPGFNGRIRVTGDIIPDQAEAYFRCGAHEVIIHGKTINASESSAGACHPRYQRVFRDRPGIDTLIPELRRHSPAHL